MVFPTTITVTNYAGDFKLLQDFHQSFLAGSFAVLTRAALDLIYATLQVWLAVLGTPDAFTFQSKIAWFAFGAGVILASLFGWLHPLNRDSEPQDGGVPPRSCSLVCGRFWSVGFLSG